MARRLALTELATPIRRPLCGCIVLNLQKMSTPFLKIDRLISVERDRSLLYTVLEGHDNPFPNLFQYIPNTF